MKYPEDVVVNEVREWRRQVSEEFGHDVYRYAEHLMRLQELHPERMLGYEPGKPVIPGDATLPSRKAPAPDSLKPGVDAAGEHVRPGK